MTGGNSIVDRGKRSSNDSRVARRNKGEEDPGRRVGGEIVGADARRSSEVVDAESIGDESCVGRRPGKGTDGVDPDSDGNRRDGRGWE